MSFKQALLVGASTNPLSEASERIRKEYEAAKLKEPTKSPKITQLEANTATALLMTGPRGQHPTWRAVRKAVHRIRHGLAIEGSWRSWPTVKGEV